LDNLALYYDTWNAKSYPGSGTTITNLMDTSNTGTITGGPAYTDQALIHAGNADYTDGSVPNFGTPSKVTVEMYCKPTSFVGFMFFGWNLYDVYCPSSNIGYNTGNSDCYGVTAARVSTIGVLNNWTHFAFVMDDTTYANNKIYINGVNESLSQILSSEATIYTDFNSGVFRIGGWRYGAGYHINMDFAVLRIYTTELTATEVEENYASIRSRY